MLVGTVWFRHFHAMRDGGGSVEVGTTGTINSLMSREIVSIESTSKLPSLCHSVSISANEITYRKKKPRKLVDDRSKSGTNIVKNDIYPKTVRKTRHYTGGSHKIPILGADNILIEETPIRQKPRNISGVVEIVDIKCGNPDKTWVNPITNRLKKIGFSKLSYSIN